MERAIGIIIPFGQGSDGAAWAGWRRLDDTILDMFSLARRSFSVVSNSLLTGTTFCEGPIVCLIVTFLLVIVIVIYEERPHEGKRGGLRASIANHIIY